MPTKDRQPTLQEAIDWLLQSRTEEYRMLSIRHWRELYGDGFAKRIVEGLEARLDRMKAGRTR